MLQEHTNKATGTHKQKDNYGCFGVGVLTGKSKKTKDYVGQFDSKSKTETQLNILIYAVALAVEDSAVEEINVITDFALIKSITDGTIDLWESNKWKKETGVNVSHDDLWQEVFALIQKFNITFSLVRESDKKMPLLAKKVATESKKAKNTTPLYEEDGEVEVTPLEEVKQEAIVEEVVKEVPVVETPKEEKVEEKPAVAPPMAEDVTTSKAKERVKSATVLTEKIQNDILVADDSAIKIDSDLKKDCEKLFGELGMPLDVSVTLFLKNAIRKKGIDFKIGLDD